MAKFYICDECKSIVLKLNSVGASPVCCGKPMRELHANSVDAAQEKHVPAFKEEGNLVKVVVGSVPHPMEDDHYIEWIYLLTDKGAQIKYLHPHDAPAAEFALSEDEVAIAVYAYCNKHGLWKANIE